MPRKNFHALIVLFSLTIILLAADPLTAQSGRKLPKGSPTVPTPTPVPEPVITVKPKPKPDFILKVYSDIELGSTFGLLMPELDTTTATRLFADFAQAFVQAGPNPKTR